MDNICIKSPDNRHVHQKNLNSRDTACIYCGDVLTTEAMEAAGIKTGDAIVNEIPGIHEIPGNEKVKAQPAPKCPGSPPLTGTDITGIMGAFEAYARILSIQARIEGMKVKNALNTINGFSPDYVQYDFDCMADELIVQAAYLQSKQINR